MDYTNSGSLKLISVSKSALKNILHVAYYFKAFIFICDNSFSTKVDVLKVEASITDKIKKVCMCLEGVLVEKKLPCEETPILKGMQFVFKKNFNEYGNCYIL